MLVGKHFDDDLVKFKSARVRYLWKKKPFRSIMNTDLKAGIFSTKINPDSRNHVTLNLLLRLRGEDYVNQEINNIANNRYPNADYLDRINDAGMKERASRIRLIEEAEKAGWTELTLKELQFNDEDAYHKILHDFNKRVSENGKVGKEELELANFMRNIKKDKTDMMKFLMTHKLREEQIKIAQNQLKDKTKEINVEADEILA